MRLAGFCAATVVLAASAMAEMPEPPGPSGAALFTKHCAKCHGAAGDGDGPVGRWLDAQPRNLRSGFLAQYSTDDLVDRILEGKSLKIEFDTEAIHERVDATENLIEHLRRLPAVDWESLHDGRDIYVARCESCHGRFGRPEPPLPDGVKAPRDLSAPEFQDSNSDSELLVAIRHGRAGMPAMTRPIDQREAIEVLTYVRLLSPGYELYTQTCAQCHGHNGRGVGSMAEEKPLPTIALDQAYLDAADPDALRVKIWHMLAEHGPRMPHFGGKLDREEAARIVEYIRSLPPRSNGTGDASLTNPAAAPPDGAADPTR